MKKITALLLSVLLIALPLAACESEDGTEYTTHTHNFSDPTCVAPKTCECGATEGFATGKHTFVDAVCTVCERKLVVELARLIGEIGSDDLLDGFYIARGENSSVEYITVYVTPAQSIDAVQLRVSVKISQEAILTGVYEWAFTRSTYYSANDAYRRHNLFGTFSTSGFSSPTDFTVTKNDGFSDNEAETYLALMPNEIDRMVKERLAPAIEKNASGITAADFGFVG